MCCQVMNFETIYKLVDAALFESKRRHLKDIEVAILRGSWQGKKYDEIAQTYGCTPEYLKQDVGPKLWKVLSEVLGEKVSKKNFQTALERRWLHLNNNITSVSPGKTCLTANREQAWEIANCTSNSDSQKAIELIYGNSLVLKLVATVVRDILDSSLIQFLEEGLNQGNLSTEDLRNIVKQYHSSRNAIGDR